MNPFAELSLGAAVALAIAVVVIVGAVIVAMLLADEAETEETIEHSPFVDEDPGREIDPAERHWVKRGPAGGR